MTRTGASVWLGLALILLTACESWEWPTDWTTHLNMERCVTACGGLGYLCVGMKEALAWDDKRVKCWCVRLGDTQEPPELEILLPWKEVLYD